VITDREIRDEATDPTFDLCMYLRSRLSHLGHILRMTNEPAEPVVCSEASLTVLVIYLWTPPNTRLQRTSPSSHSTATVGNSQARALVAPCALTLQQTLIDALPWNSIHAYTDGNGAGGYWGKTGWGAWSMEQVLTQSSPERHPPMHQLSDLWGPVVTNNW
jgi:hypothetical protein